LRQICGSLQYAAVQTRPDICAKVGLLQSAIPRACIEDLLEANRVLLEAKAHPVILLIVPIPQASVAFCGLSDASFEAKKGVFHLDRGPLFLPRMGTWPKINFL